MEKFMKFINHLRALSLRLVDFRSFLAGLENSRRVSEYEWVWVGLDSEPREYEYVSTHGPWKPVSMSRVSSIANENPWVWVSVIICKERLSCYFLSGFSSNLKFISSKFWESPANLGESWRKNSAKLGENTAKMTLIFWLTHAQSMSKKLWVHSKKSVSEYEWAWVEQFSKCVSMSQVSVMLPKNPWVWVTESLIVLTHVLMSDSTRGISNPASW